MKLFKDVKAENVPGKWVKYPPEVKDANGKTVQAAGEIELLIRPISPSKALEIERKHLGVKREFKVGADYRTVDVNVELMDRVALEKAGFALLDSKNATVEIGDEDSKRFYSKLAQRELSVGDEFTLDGNWVPQVKDRIFRELHDLVAFVIEKSAEAGQEEADKEAALSKRAE